MIGRCLALSLLLFNSVLSADNSQRREPSLFLEYEREVARSIDTTQDEPNPFKRMMAPIASPKVPTPPLVKATIPSVSEKISTVDKSEIGTDSVPYLVINKTVEPVLAAPISCPTPVIAANVPNNEKKSKKSLLENIKSVKESVLARAKNFLGTPYGFGSKEAMRTDCSGFTQQVFSQFGVALPHSAAGQAEYGEHVAIADLQVGDLMFYRTYKDEPSHVAIYAGDGQIIHASYKNKRVQYDAMNKGYYKQRFMYAKRLALNHRDTSDE